MKEDRDISGAVPGPAGITARSPDFYRCMFEHLPDAVLVEDRTGKILECNEAALQIFGYSRKEMLGLRFGDLVPFELKHTLPQFLDETNTTGGVFVWISCRKKNGSIFPTQYANRVVALGDEGLVLAFIRDVSEDYYCRHPVAPRDRLPEMSSSRRDSPGLTLTWECQNGAFVLIGYDDRAIGSTKDLIKNFLGRSARDLYAERHDMPADLERCLREKTILQRKTLYRMFTTGEELVTEITYSFAYPNLVIMHIEDFTERDAREALNISFVRNSPVGLCLIHSGRLKIANPKFMEYTGFNESELSDIEPLSLIHPDDRHLLIRDILESVKSAGIQSMPVELRILTKGGDTKWMMVTLTSIFYLGEQAILFNLVDITELKTARQRVDELTALQSSILSAIPHAVIGLDNRRIVFTNHAVRDVFGWKPYELIGRTMRVLFPDRSGYVREARRLYEELDSRDSLTLEHTYKRKDGSDVICLTSVSRISPDRNDKRIVATHTDITEKRRAEQALSESQRMIATLMGNLPGMAYRCANDGHWSMEFVSEGCLGLTGYKPAELVGNAQMSYGDLIHPKDRQAVWESVRQSLKTGERFQIMYRIITSEGRLKWVWEKGLGIVSPSSELVTLEGFISDITGRKMAEEQMERSRMQLRAHAEHLHSVLEGERTKIAREIHDELGQILTALKMDLFWVERKLPWEWVEIHDKVRSMITHIDSTIKTVERILLELRPGMLEDLGLTPAIEWQAEAFQRRTGIVCDAILDPDPESLITDTKISTAVFRICQEALTNIARHSNATRAEIRLTLHESLVELVVADNGKGVKKRDIDKADSFGILGIRERTGLLGGKMTIAGRRGKGTILRVRIPLCRSQGA